MANRIERPGYQAELRRRLGLTEQTPAPMLAPELMPVIEVDADDPLYWWIGNKTSWSARYLVAGVAAEYGYFALINPAESGFIAKILDVSLNHLGAAGYVLYGWGGTTLTATLTQRTACVAQDSRRVVSGAPQAATPLQLWTGTDASAALQVSQIGARYLPATNTTARAFYPGQVLPPGSTVCLRAAAVNVALDCGITWVQRRYDESEEAAG